MNNFTVYVYNDHRTSPRKGHHNKPLAYLRSQGAGACVHTIYTYSAAHARREAIGSHLEMVDCSQEDKRCAACKLAMELARP